MVDDIVIARSIYIQRLLVTIKMEDICISAI